jgi:PhnB protein
MTEQKVFAHLAVNDGQAAIAFYQKALGAKVEMQMPAEDGKRLMHADLSINGTRFFLHDDFPEHRSKFSKAAWSPKVVGGTTVTVHVMVDDCDATFKRAVDAGAESIMEPADMFWGDRYAQVIDPFGHVWSFSHPLKKA